MEVEARAVLQGLRYCLNTGRDKVIVETDSMVLQKIIHKEWKIPWNIKEDIEKI